MDNTNKPKYRDNSYCEYKLSSQVKQQKLPFDSEIQKSIPMQLKVKAWRKFYQAESNP